MSFIRTEQGKNVIFFGADYDKIEMKSLYKALNVSKPDLVMVQLSPEYLLDNFEQHPEKYVQGEWLFNDLKYM